MATNNTHTFLLRDIPDDVWEELEEERKERAKKRYGAHVPMKEVILDMLRKGVMSRD